MKLRLYICMVAVVLTFFSFLFFDSRQVFAEDESGTQVDGLAQVVEMGQLSGPQAPNSGWLTTTLQAGVNSITAIAHTSDGRIFAGIAGNGLRIYAPDANGLYSWQNPPAGGPVSQSISALAIYRNQLWVGTSNAGISVLDLTTSSWSSYTASNSPLPNNSINRLSVLDRPSDPDDIWISTNGGAARFRTPPDAGNVTWKVLTTADGLPSNTIYDIAPWDIVNNRDAFIGTDLGVKFYNGTTFSDFNGGTDCSFSRATRIHVDRSNRIWFAAEVEIPALAAAGADAPASSVWDPIGICRYSFNILSSTWTKLASPTLPWPSNEVSDMSNDDAGRVWLSFRQRGNGTSSGAAAYDHDHWLILKPTTAPMLTNNLNVVDAVGDDVWLGYAGTSVFSVYSPNWSYFTQAKVGVTAAPTTLLLEANQTWVAAGKQISKWDGTNWQAQTLPANSDVTALARGSDGLLWIGTANDGVWSLDNANHFSQQSTSDGLGDNRVRALLNDSTGRLWVATQAGLSLHGNNSWLTFTSANAELVSDDLTALTSDALGRIWIGTAANGISIFDPQAQGSPAWSKQTTTDGLLSNNIRALATDPSGNVWVATAAGVGKWDAQSTSWSSFTTSNGLPSNTVLNISADPSGNVWAATAKGIALKRQNDWQNWHVTSSFIGSDQALALAADESRLWVVAGDRVAVRSTLIEPIGNKPPVINSINPASGAPGSIVVINGSDFDTSSILANEVRFCCLNGQSGKPAPRASVLVVTSTQMTVSVPAQAQTGKLILKTINGQSESVQEFKVTPTITDLGTTCSAVGGEIAIHGSGFLSAGESPAYVTIGNGTERLADVTNSTVISTFIRVGDTSGPIKIRLNNNETVISSDEIQISKPTLQGVNVQQGLSGQQNIWGKRTLVQAKVRSDNTDCDAHIDSGRLLWKLKDGSTRDGGIAYFSSPDGLIVKYFPDFSDIDASANFIAEYGTGRSGFSSSFPLNQFNGVKLILRNGFVDVLTVDVEPSKFNFIDIGSNRQFRIMQVSSTSVDGMDPKFWENARINAMEAARIYPQPDISPFFGDYPWMDWIPVSFSLSSQISFTLDYNDEAVKVIKMVDDYLDPSGDTYGVALIDPGLIQKGSNAAGLSIGGHTAIVVNDPNAGGKTFMHEGMHNFGAVASNQSNYLSNYGGHSRYDEGQWFDKDAADKGISNCDNALTFRQALIDETGNQSRVVLIDSGPPVQFNLAGCGVSGNPKSLLSYAPGRNNWNVFLEPLDYQFALNDLKALAQTQAMAASILVTENLHLAGDISLGNQVTLTIGYVSSEAGDFTPAVADGHYHLQLRDVNSQLLYDQPFELDFGGSHTHGEEDDQHHENPPLSEAHFNVRIPFPAGVSKAEIRHVDDVIWTKSVSTNAPTVAFVAPNGGSFQASDSIAISWNASDADNDPLLYSLEYSADNGQNWIMVAPVIKTTSFVWQPSFVPASPTALLRIRASDGFKYANATSAPFALAPHAPLALILEPSDVLTFSEGAKLNLMGGSVTADGFDQGTFVWKHGTQTIGTERDASYRLNSAGIHTFTLQVTANGLTGSTSVSVTVLADYDHDGMSNEWELAYKLNPLDASDAYSDTDGDNLINLQEMRLLTDPRKSDTDGDTFADGTEIEVGTDPLQAGSRPVTTPVLQVGAVEFSYAVETADQPLRSAKFWVTNSGGGSLSWKANSDAAWLTLSPTQGSAPTEVTIQAVPTGLADGTYEGHITFTASGAAQSPQQITVTLTVGESSAGTEKIYLPLVQR